MGANPHANGGRAGPPLEIPDIAAYAVAGRAARDASTRSRPGASASCCATSTSANAEAANFRLFCPDETNSNRLGAVFEVEDRCLMDARTRATTTSRPTAG